jgi:hypothetical protein
LIFDFSSELSLRFVVLLSLLAVSCYYSAVKVPAPDSKADALCLLAALRIGRGNLRTASVRRLACFTIVLSVC